MESFEIIVKTPLNTEITTSIHPLDTLTQIKGKILTSLKMSANTACQLVLGEQVLDKITPRSDGQALIAQRDYRLCAQSKVILLLNMQTGALTSEAQVLMAQRDYRLLTGNKITIILNVRTENSNSKFMFLADEADLIAASKGEKNIYVGATMDDGKSVIVPLKVTANREVIVKNSLQVSPTSSVTQSQPPESIALILSKECAHCQKKLRDPIIYPCRCRLCFCSKHRLPETHSCTFNYRKIVQ